MKLRLGILGTGTRGRCHLQTLQSDFANQVEVAALGERRTAGLAQASEIVAGVHIFEDEGELLRSDLDAVCVATPNFTHVPLALQMLKAGKHLLLETPCGITRAECHLLAKAAGRTDRVVMIANEGRHAPLFQQVKARVDAGEIGRPHGVGAAVRSVLHDFGGLDDRLAPVRRPAGGEQQSGVRSHELVGRGTARTRSGVWRKGHLAGKQH
jgi:predicted dehydrogenase